MWQYQGAFQPTLQGFYSFSSKSWFGRQSCGYSTKPSNPTSIIAMLTVQIKMLYKIMSLSFRKSCSVF
jgi:hypothetical protein